jgi:ketosteroid isomerase-like protein
MMRLSRFACGAAIVSVLALACESERSTHSSIDGPDMDAVLVHESAWVRVYTEPDLPFCRGDGARIDAHLERMASKLGVTPPRVPVYLVAEDRGEAIADWCFGSFTTLGGCFQPWVVMSKFWALPHELNHVVLESLNNNHDVRGSSLFWFEAYASTWETHATKPVMTGLAEQDTWAAYRTADHLIRWLEDIRGSAAVRDFYAGLEREWEPADVEAAFEDAFGRSYEQALARFEVEAPPMYPGFGWCAEAEVIDVPFGETRVTLRFDCDAADTFALAERTIDGMYVRRIVRLEQAADLRIESSREVRVLRRHPCLETPVESEEDPRLGESAWAEQATSGGTVTTIEGVPAGDNLIELIVPRGRAVEVELVIVAEPATAI